MEDYYKILGVREDATDEEIKAAFRKRAKETHPDTNGNDPENGDTNGNDPENGEEHNEEFSKVSDAYSTLSNGEKRKAYDSFREQEKKKKELVVSGGRDTENGNKRPPSSREPVERNNKSPIIINMCVVLAAFSVMSVLGHRYMGTAQPNLKAAYKYARQSIMKRNGPSASTPAGVMESFLEVYPSTLKTKAAQVFGAISDDVPSKGSVRKAVDLLKEEGSFRFAKNGEVGRGTPPIQIINVNGRPVAILHSDAFFTGDNTGTKAATSVAASAIEAAKQLESRGRIEEKNNTRPKTTRGVWSGLFEKFKL